ncbi:MAG: hypothetical protein H0W14_03225 [Actinobacteria bacterium]|nr:hypothetical protein [Actinomycetota bacterium]
MPVAFLNRTLDQELAAIARGASLECLVCGEFVLHGRRGVISCPECGLLLQAEGQLVALPGRESRSAG